MTINESTETTVLITVAITAAYHALVSFTRSWEPSKWWQKWAFLGFFTMRVLVPIAVFAALVLSHVELEMKLCVGLLLVVSGVLEFCSRK